MVVQSGEQMLSYTYHPRGLLVISKDTAVNEHNNTDPDHKVPLMRQNHTIEDQQPLGI